MATYKGVVPSGKYTFNAAAKTITFDSDYTGLALSDIMLITNVKSGTAITIYDPFDSTRGGVLSTLTLTLNYNTTAMSNTDPLQIIVGMVNLPTSLPTGAATETTLSSLNTKIPSNLTVTSTRLLVDGSGVVQPVSGTFWQATQPVSLTSLPSLAAGTNAIGSITNTTFASTQSGTWTVGLDAGSNAIGSITNTSFEATQGTATNLKNHSHALALLSPPSYSDGDVASMSLTLDGKLRVDGSSVTQPVSGSVSISSGFVAVSQSTAANLNATVVGTGTFAVQAAQSGTWNVGTVSTITNAVTVSQGTATNLKAQAESYQGGSAVSSSNPLYVTVAASATGGDTVYHLVSAASTNPVNIKASAGKVTGWYIYNSNASPRKVAFHNTAGTPTAGTSVYYSLVIPGSSGANVSFPSGLNFSTGIAITTVTGLTDADATAVAASDLIINIFYK